MDFDWILDEAVRVRRELHTHDNKPCGWCSRYLVTTLDNMRQACLSWTDQGRLLFNGEDIETEAFMAYVGLMDAVDETPRGDMIFYDDCTVKVL